jgi:transcriptional regulator with XRE-family HTH domain
LKHQGFGETLRRLRTDHGLTQQEVADELIKLAWTQRKLNVGVDRQMVSKWEREKKSPDGLYRELLCLLYGASQQQLGFRPSVSRRTVLMATPTLMGAMDHLGELESPLDVLERIQALTATNTSDETIKQIEDVVELIVDQYETSGPVALAPRALRQRRLVDELLSGRQLPRQRDRLYVAGAKLSALLGYMAVNLGKFPLARAYCSEAFQLGDQVNARDLQAWVRGTESFCAYYTNDYAQALAFAQDGQRYAGGGPQAVRLAINGEARALAKLGDARGVDEAVERAYKVSDRFETVGGVSSCISFGIYSEARTASNAATAYVSLGQPEQVQRYADLAMPVFETSESRWSQSLIRLDLANALLSTDHPEPEHSARLAIDALTISAERPITSVLTRSREVLAASVTWGHLPEVAELSQTLRAAERL